MPIISIPRHVATWAGARRHNLQGNMQARIGHAKGIVVRDLTTGQISSHSADAVVLATGGYGPVFYLSTNAVGCNVTATYRAFKKGAYFSNPCYTQIHPTCIPVNGDHQSILANVIPL